MAAAVMFCSAADETPLQEPLAIGSRAPPSIGRAQGTTNVAPTARACDMPTEQVRAVPLHAPLHPENTQPLDGVAVRVTEVPLLNALVQVPPQLMPLGDETTVPVPLRVICSGWVIRAKVAVTLRAALIVTVQVPVPLHPLPLQPVRRMPSPGTAVSVTVLPSGCELLQVLPQSIPAGSDTTAPVPTRATVSV